MAAPHLELLQSDDHRRYVLDSPAEIARHLGQLRDRGTFLSLHAGGQTLERPAVLMDVGNQEIILDCDSATIDRLSGRTDIAVSTSLDQVRIQFDAARPRRAMRGGNAALAADLPQSMLRLQRRSFFRLTTPRQPALLCQLALDRECNQWVETRILDISVGGLAIVAPPLELPLQANMLFPSCRFTLPDGRIDAALRVRNLFQISMPGAGRVLRAGCQFEALSGPMGNALQRYILNIERSRRAR